MTSSSPAPVTMELDRSAHEERVDGSDDAYNEEPVSLAEIEASVKRVLGVEIPLLAWASSSATPDADDIGPILREWFGVAAP